MNLEEEAFMIFRSFFCCSWGLLGGSMFALTGSGVTEIAIYDVHLFWSICNFGGTQLQRERVNLDINRFNNIMKISVLK